MKNEERNTDPWVGLRGYTASYSTSCVVFTTEQHCQEKENPRDHVVRFTFIGSFRRLQHVRNCTWCNPRNVVSLWFGVMTHDR